MNRAPSQISSYEDQELKFGILEIDVVVCNSGKIEASIVVSNKNDFDWN